MNSSRIRVAAGVAASSVLRFNDTTVTASENDMASHRGWVIGFFAGVLVSAAAVGLTRLRAEAPPKSEVPRELVALNGAGHEMYLASRKRELAAVPAVVFVSGNDLVLRRGDERLVATV